MLQADTLFAGPVVTDTVITTGAPAPAAVPDTTGIDLAGATTEAVSTLQGFANGFFAALPRVAVALVVLAGFWALARVVRGIVHRVLARERVAHIGEVVGRLVNAALLVFGTLVALVIVFPTFTVGSLLGALGIGGIAIGFAFKDIFQNLLAGILILLQQPFREGDEITSGGFTGAVEAIDTRATFIKTYDGQRVIIPNSRIFSEPVSVITAYDVLRSEYDVGIGYGDDIEAAKEILTGVLDAIPAVLRDPAPRVLTWSLDGSAVVLRLYWWTRPQRGMVTATRDAVIHRAKVELTAAGVDLPFETQVVLWHDQTEDADGDRTRQREGWPMRPGGPPSVPARRDAGGGGRS